MNTLASSLGKTPSKKGNTMPKKGNNLVLSGLDGSGKSTLMEMLKQHYTEKGYSVKTAHLPFDEHLRYEVLPKLKSSYADRLLFALDNYIYAEQLEQWQYEYDLIISQRGWIDSFVHGAVQGYSYKYIAQLNQVEKLPKVDVMIHLVASAQVAYERIKNDPNADKFEYPAYLRQQEVETRRGFDELIAGNPDLHAFAGTKNILIDTTYLSIEETFDNAIGFLDGIGFMK